MHSPPSFDVFSRIMEIPVELISFGSYVIDICFQNGNRLSIHAPFRFGKKNSIAEAPVLGVPVKETGLVRLIGEQVGELKCEPGGTLDLIFKNDDRLIVYASDPLYEAYCLEVDGAEYPV